MNNNIVESVLKAQHPAEEINTVPYIHHRIMLRAVALLKKKDNPGKDKQIKAELSTQDG